MGLAGDARPSCDAINNRDYNEGEEFVAGCICQALSRVIDERAKVLATQPRGTI